LSVKLVTGAIDKKLNIMTAEQCTNCKLWFICRWWHIPSATENINNI